MKKLQNKFQNSILQIHWHRNSTQIETSVRF